MFAAIGRFSHGFPVFDAETLRTADPFIAGWFLSAYFLGGFSEDGRGMNGSNKAVFAAAKSWALDIPVGLGIHALTSAHFPPTNFILVTLGSTTVLLIGWRTLLFQILPDNTSKKDDMYKRGSPFELFERHHNVDGLNLPEALPLLRTGPAGYNGSDIRDPTSNCSPTTLQQPPDEYQHDAGITIHMEHI